MHFVFLVLCSVVSKLFLFTLTYLICMCLVVGVPEKPAEL